MRSTSRSRTSNEPSAGTRAPANVCSRAVPPPYDSGQWSKAIAAAVKKAKANLKKDLSSSTAPRHPAIVLDVDETAVFNAPCLEPVDWDLVGLATCATT